MGVYTRFGVAAPLVLVVFYCLQNTAMATSGKELFSYEYLDTENTILKLRCDGGCSTDMTVVTIVIYNQTSMNQLCAVNSGKAPNVFKPPLQEISYFVAGGLFENDNSKSCQLELVITNCNLLTRLHFGCNVSQSDIKGTITTYSTSLIVDRKASTPQGSHNMATTTLIILIVVIVVLFLLAVFFLSMWLRGCCRYRDSLIYQTSSQRKVSSQVYAGENGSVVSYQSSPAIDGIDSEFKFQSRNGSVRRMNSRSETNVVGNRVVYPALPAAPPPKYWREKQNSQVTCSYIKVPYTYARPQDAIDPDFIEEVDVDSSNNVPPLIYAKSNTLRDRGQRPSFYSSVAVNQSVDV